MKMIQNPETITLIADPRVVSIPIKENGDPLINLKDQTHVSYGPSPEIPNNTDYTKMRKPVYEMILEAEKLLPSGIRFCVYECYRSLELQTLLFNTRYDIIKQNHPNWSEEELFNETIKLVSPIMNLDGSKNIPAHATAGAIDIYLINENDQPLEMGIHPKDWMEDKDGSLSQTHSKVISKEAQQNRALMSKALETVGFVNYATEFWHWSYGDRYWAYQLNKTHAIYGSTTNSGN